MRIYRIETAKNDGCFRGEAVHGDSLVNAACNNVWCEGYEDEPTPQRHPSPMDDSDLRPVFRTGVHYFGFNSVEQLLRWFDSERIRRAMSALGGKLVEYECADEFCIVSRVQTVFEMAHATRILERPIPTAS